MKMIEKSTWAFTIRKYAEESLTLNTLQFNDSPKLKECLARIDGMNTLLQAMGIKDAAESVAVRVVDRASKRGIGFSEIKDMANESLEYLHSQNIEETEAEG